VVPETPAATRLSPTAMSRKGNRTAMTNARDSVDTTGAAPVIYSRAEAAGYLDVSLRTFDRLRAGLPYVVIGRRRKYLKRDLDAYIAERRSI